MADANVLQVLASALNPDANIRVQAENTLDEYFHNPEISLALANILVSHQIDISLRQLAGITLRKYILAHWSPIFPGFKGEAPQPPTKQPVRALLFSAISDPNSKIRSTAAFSLSTVAHADWPDEWPELHNELLGVLTSGNKDGTHGAMMVFTEFVRSDMTEEQLLPILRPLLPALMSIISDTFNHSAQTRARTVLVFRQCLECLFMIKDQHPVAVKEISAQVIPEWINALTMALATQPALEGGEIALRSQIFKTLYTIQTTFPRSLSAVLPGLLNASLSHLSLLGQSGYISSPDADSPDLDTSLSNLGALIMDWLNSVCRSKRSNGVEWFKNDQILGELVACILKWGEMTPDDEESWLLDSNAFISSEDDEDTDGPWSIRNASYDLLSELLDKFALQTTQTLQSLTFQITTQSSAARASHNPQWWKPLESLLSTLCSSSSSLIETIQEENEEGRPSPFDMSGLLGEVVPNVLGLSEFPFLQGRSFVFASKFAKLLPIDMAGRYLGAVLDVLEAQHAAISVPVKASAVKALLNFTQTLPSTTLQPITPRLISALGPLLLNTSGDTLILVLDALRGVVGIGIGEGRDDLVRDVGHVLSDVWRKAGKDPVLFSVLSDIYTTLSPSRVFSSTIVPTLVTSLQQAYKTGGAEESWVVSTGIELITSLLRGVSKGGVEDGFWDCVVTQGGVWEVLGGTDDRDILVKGIELLTYALRKCPTQVLSSPTSISNLEVFITTRLLSPELHESGGLFVGDLIIHLIRNGGVNEGILRGLVGRMRSAGTASFLQSLIVPFAYLITTPQKESLLHLLEITQLDNNQSGLEVFLKTWCENAETIQGFWANRVSVMAMCELFVSDRESVNRVLVQGDIIIKEATKDVIMTRSRAKQIPTEYTQIPFKLKVLKVLAHEISGEAEGVSGDVIEGVDSDDGDDEWADEENLGGTKKEEFGYLSDLLDDDEADDGSGYGMDDEELRSDPITEIDLKAHLSGFLRDCAGRDPTTFGAMVDLLNGEEALAVTSAVRG